MPYERTQEASWAAIVLAWSKHPRVTKAVPWAATVVPVLLAGSMLSRMTIRVDGAGVTWYFGWGFPGGSIAMGAIDHAQTVQTNLLHALGGVNVTSRGWLWSVGGLQAVEIFKTGGGSVTLGTDDPQGLAQAIERFRAA